MEDVEDIEVIKEDVKDIKVVAEEHNEVGDNSLGRWEEKVE